MSFSKKYILSRKDYNTVIDFIKREYKVDLSQHAYSITKHRIETYFAQKSIVKLEILLNFLKKPIIWDGLFQYLQVPTTEMFRDSEMWGHFKFKVLSKFIKNNQLNIWLPNISSGEDLFSLLIILSETDLIEKTEIVITSENEKIGELIRNNTINEKKYVSSKHNYLAYLPGADFNKYFDSVSNKIELKKELLKNVVFKKYSFVQNLYFEKYFDIILFRNKMLYFGPMLQKQALDILNKSLKVKGYMIIGIQETLKNWSKKNSFSALEKDCCIYQKKK